MFRASRSVPATISILLVGFAALNPRAIAQTPQASKHHPAVAEHELFAPYWTAEAGWRTEVQMRNNLCSRGSHGNSLSARRGWHRVSAPAGHDCIERD